ncbi:MAG TPA: EamA family transporter [Candidatus Omnitrophota bacterium]|nr:EamA family transporter [Candidatus Omnitrophota bacterium]HPS19649.1 EamA family transporter [Candidatus Omnitrophota bacterium]
MDAFLWALLTAFIWGGVPLLEKAGLSRIDPVVGLFYRCLGVVIGVVCLSIFVVKPVHMKTADLKSIIFLVLAGFLASFVAQVTFYQGLKVGEVSKVVPISAMYYVISFVLGIVVLKESVTPAKVLGIIMMIGGAWLIK